MDDVHEAAFSLADRVTSRGDVRVARCNGSHVTGLNMLLARMRTRSTGSPSETNSLRRSRANDASREGTAPRTERSQEPEDHPAVSQLSRQAAILLPVVSIDHAISYRERRNHVRAAIAAIEQTVAKAKRQIALLALVALVAGFAEALTILLIVGAATSQLGDGTTAEVASTTLDPPAAIVAGLVGSVTIIFLHGVIARQTAELSSRTLSAARHQVLDAFGRADWDRQSTDREAAIHDASSTLAQRSAALAAAVANTLANSVAALALCLIAIVANPGPALIALVVGGSLALLMRPLSARTRQLATSFHEESARYADGVSQYAQLAREFRTFGVEQRQQAELARLGDESAARYRRLRWSTRFASYAFKDAAILALALAVGVMWLASGSDLVGAGAVVLVLIRALVYSQQALASHQVVLEEGPAFDRLIHYVESLRARPDPLGFRHPSLVEIELRDVSYRYADGRRGVLDISTSLAAGEFVGVIGPSGAGKTTLLELLLRLRAPTDGEILIDHVPLLEVDQMFWAQHVAFVPQEPRLVRGTVMDNITLGRPDIDEHAVREAAIAAHLDQEIQELPRGYETVLGPRGVGLSGGQQQRLALARALVGRPRLLLLDEPTSALDPDTETRVKRTLDELHGELTMLVVAHRRSTITSCDRVWALHAGRLLADGDFDAAAAALARRGAQIEFLDETEQQRA